MYRILLFLIFMSTAAFSADDTGKTFYAVLSYGWQINLILGCLLFFGLFVIFHTILTTRSRHTVPNKLLRTILDDLASGDVEAARGRAEAQPCILSSVLIPGLKLHNHPIERIHAAMEGAGRRSVGGLKQRVSYLSNIGVLSPMIGLMGTVMGLLKAFNVMGSEVLAEGSKPVAMAAAIGEAMGTTAVGLAVGIPAMMAFFLCMSRLGRIGDEIEIASEEVAEALAEIK